MKIGIIVFSLSKGGAERSSAILSKMLTKAGYEVTIICVTDDVDYSYEGRLINLDQIVSPKMGIAKRFAKIQYVRKFLKKEQFDYVIDTRSRRSWLKQFFIGVILLRNERMIYMVHSYNLRFYFSKYVKLARYIYGSAYKIVGVSKAAIQRVQDEYGFNQCVCIHNAFNDSFIKKQSEEPVKLPNEKYILSYGRIADYVKDYRFLIRVYKKSELPSKGVKLLILGDGPDKDMIMELVKKEGLQKDVIFNGFTSNPFPYVKNALLTTLTSNYEGFPMILIESMAMETPVISVDCKSGPSEIIETGKNGVLVPYKSEEKFVEALNKMIADKEFYQRCKEGTLDSVEKFKMENITKQWENILI